MDTWQGKWNALKYPASINAKKRRNETRSRAFQFLFIRFTSQRYYFCITIIFWRTLICLISIVIRDIPAIQICAAFIAMLKKFIIGRVRTNIIEEWAQMINMRIHIYIYIYMVRCVFIFIFIMKIVRINRLIAISLYLVYFVSVYRTMSILYPS